MNYIKSLSFLLIIIVVSACNSKPATEVRTDEAHDEIIRVTPAQFKNANMSIGKLEEKPFSKVIRSSGVLDVPPQNKAEISAFMGGFIKDLPHRIGSKVKKGERLVTLENPEFISLQQQYLELGEQMEYLKSEYERQQIMLDEKITSQKSFLKAESDYKSNLARYNSLKKNLEMLHINPSSVRSGNITSQVNIYSPIDGYVTQVFGIRGSYVSSADKILELVNTDEILLDLKVFEKDLFSIKPGQEVLFRIPEVSDEKFKAKIQLIGASISENRMIPVQAVIEDGEDRNFTSGMFVEAEIIASEERLPALPENAVTEFEGKDYVLVVEKEDESGLELIAVEVKTGEVYDGWIHIKNSNDFSSEMRILTKGAFVLLIEDTGDLED